jgi:hypothetical protein
MNFKRRINQDVFSIRIASLGLPTEVFGGGAKLCTAAIGRERKVFADGMSVGWYD